MVCTTKQLLTYDGHCKGTGICQLEGIGCCVRHCCLPDVEVGRRVCRRGHIRWHTVVGGCRLHPGEEGRSVATVREARHVCWALADHRRYIICREMKWHEHSRFPAFHDNNDFSSIFPWWEFKNSKRYLTHYSQSSLLGHETYFLSQ